MYIKCPGILESRFLVGTGIISIEPNCQIKTDNVIIRGFKTIETERMREIVPAARMRIDINETLERALKLDEFQIENIITPNIVNLGQKEKLQDISMGIDRVRILENELRNQWTPSKMKGDIWKIATAILIVAVLVGIIIAGITIKKLKKIGRVRKARRIERGENVSNTHIPEEKIDDDIEAIELQEVDENTESVVVGEKEKKKVSFNWHP